MSDNPLLPKPREMWVELLSGDFEPRKQELERLLGDAGEAEDKATKAVELEKENPADRRFGQQSRLPDLRAELDKAKAESDRLAEEYDALMAEAREHGIIKMLVRSSGRTWRRLKDEHPPRPDDEGDEFAGFNRATFFEVAVKPCIVDPKFTDEQYDEFVEQASEANWQKVANAAWHVNENTVDIPKSSAVSLVRQTRGVDSEPAESSESTPEPSTESQPSSATTTPKAS